MVMDRVNELLQKLKELAEGEADPKVVSEWAVNQELNFNKENVTLSEAEEELLSNLQLAGALNEHGAYLYDTEDFRKWLKDYLSENNNN